MQKHDCKNHLSKETRGIGLPPKENILDTLERKGMHIIRQQCLVCGKVFDHIDWQYYRQKGVVK